MKKLFCLIILINSFLTAKCQSSEFTDVGISRIRPIPSINSDSVIIYLDPTLIIEKGNSDAEIKIKEKDYIKKSDIEKKSTYNVPDFSILSLKKNINLKSATIIQYTIKGRFMSR